MGRGPTRYLVCLLLLALLPVAEGRSATLPGHAVFVKVTGAADDARSDVYEQSLAGGPARVLVSRTALPKSFRGRIEGALPSPDGALLLLEESDGVIIRNRRTGARRLVLGNGYGTEKGEVVAEEFSGSYWLWSRRARTVKRIALCASRESLAMLGCSQRWTDWSPRGRLLLLHVLTGYSSRTTEYRSEALRVFDAATSTRRALLTTRGDVLFARWTSDGAAVLVGERVGGKTCRLELVSLTGKTQRLFTRPLRVSDDGEATSPFDAAISPDGQQVAVAESSGYFLFSREGRARRNLGLPKMGDSPWPFDTWPLGNMAFSPDGKTLAVLVSFGHGHGEGKTVEEALWTVQSKTATAPWRLALGSSADDDIFHLLLGWVPGQPAVLLVTGNATEAGLETSWRKLWLQPVESTQPARLLADTGPGGLDMSWWGALPKQAAAVRPTRAK